MRGDMAPLIVAASRVQLRRPKAAGVDAVLSERLPLMTTDAESSCHRVLLAAIDSALENSGALRHQALSGVRITVKLRGDKTPRAVIVEPELRFEST